MKSLFCLEVGPKRFTMTTSVSRCHFVKSGLRLELFWRLLISEIWFRTRTSFFAWFTLFVVVRPSACYFVGGTG